MTSMRIPFAKLHGLGNDFIVSDARTWQGEARKLARSLSRERAVARGVSDLASKICERHTGVGADGFLVILAPQNRTENNARVRFFNADGGEAEMSGNGIRCVGGALMQSKRPKRLLRIETPGGVRTLELIRGGEEKWVFRVAMGNPILDPAEIPFRGERAAAPVIAYPLVTTRGKFRVTVTSMGNPHCSVFVKKFSEVDWPAVGSEIERHRLFPNRTNVEFVRVVSRREIEVRYWERGVGITASSGTGSCAAVVASVLNGLTGRRVRVRTVAGLLTVAWPQEKGVQLTGPAQSVAQGTYTCAWR